MGSGAAVAAVDEAVRYMKEGGILQVINSHSTFVYIYICMSLSPFCPLQGIVPAELGYPVKGDQEHERVGPK